MWKLFKFNKKGQTKRFYSVTYRDDFRQFSHILLVPLWLG